MSNTAYALASQALQHAAARLQVQYPALLASCCHLQSCAMASTSDASSSQPKSQNKKQLFNPAAGRSRGNTSGISPHANYFPNLKTLAGLDHGLSYANDKRLDKVRSPSFGYIPERVQALRLLRRYNLASPKLEGTAILAKVIRIAKDKVCQVFGSVCRHLLGFMAVTYTLLAHSSLLPAHAEVAAFSRQRLHALAASLVEVTGGCRLHEAAIIADLPACIQSPRRPFTLTISYYLCHLCHLPSGVARPRVLRLRGAGRRQAGLQPSVR